MSRIRTAIGGLRRLVETVLESGRRRASFAGAQALSPVFVIGANRSGTSVVSSILAQHPELEGLFAGSLDPSRSIAGHSIGFCESSHVWPWLMPDEAQRRANGDLPFWGLPEYLASAYRCHVSSDRERGALAFAVERLRRTPRDPLIKDQVNTLRIGLIRDVFPNARFVLVTRPWRDFLARGLDKWARDGLGTRLSAARPVAGLHWYLLNLVARYDLEAYAPGRYAELWLDALQDSADSARGSLQSALKAIRLSSFEFDLAILEPQWARTKGTPARRPEDPEFGLIPDIVEAERTLLRELGADRG